MVVRNPQQSRAKRWKRRREETDEQKLRVKLEGILCERICAAGAPLLQSDGQ